MTEPSSDTILAKENDTVIFVCNSISGRTATGIKWLKRLEKENKVFQIPLDNPGVQVYSNDNVNMSYSTLFYRVSTLDDNARIYCMASNTTHEFFSVRKPLMSIQCT